nr:cation:dicarboxylase symporter family transporter [Oceanobacillus senegalensis]
MLHCFFGVLFHRFNCICTNTLSKWNLIKNNTHARTQIITAFASQSSSGTLPLTLNTAKDLGLSKSLYGFSLPLGATINMDGAAIRFAMDALIGMGCTALNVTGDLVGTSIIDKTEKRAGKSMEG